MKENEGKREENLKGAKKMKARKKKMKEKNKKKSKISRV